MKNGQKLKLGDVTPRNTQEVQASKLGDCYSVMVPEKKLLACSSKSLCVVNDQPVGNPKRKV
jgi:hypothetical protein